MVILNLIFMVELNRGLCKAYSVDDMSKVTINRHVQYDDMINISPLVILTVVQYEDECLLGCCAE
jgi:hypothetical protein